MSFRSSKTLNILHRRGLTHIKPVNHISTHTPFQQLPKRYFGYYRRFGDWNRWRQYHQLRMAKMAERMADQMGANNNGKQHFKDGKFGLGKNNKHDYFRCGRRFHGHYGHRYYGHGHRLWVGGLSLGTCLSVVISFHENESIIWAIIHGFLSWFYVGYYGLTKYNEQNRSANELITLQIDEISNEIEKLNKIYKKVMSEVNTNEDDNGNNAVQYSGGYNDSGKGSGNDGNEENRMALDRLKMKIDRLSNDIANIKKSGGNGNSDI